MIIVFGEVLAIGLGTSLLQFKNIVKRPVIWIPPLLASMLSGMISVLFSLRCNVQGSAMGLTGLLGLTDSFSIMATNLLDTTVFDRMLFCQWLFVIVCIKHLEN